MPFFPKTLQNKVLDTKKPQHIYKFDENFKKNLDRFGGCVIYIIFERWKRIVNLGKGLINLKFSGVGI